MQKSFAAGLESAYPTLHVSISFDCNTTTYILTFFFVVVEVTSTNDMVYIFTSGTTGLPKAVR